MESESLALLKRRAQELWEQIEALRAEISPLQAEFDQVKRGIAAMAGPFAPTGAEASRNAVAHFTRKANPEAQSLTIKQMVITILREHMPNGATANELLDAFARLWGRKELRTSLSPQLTRLKREGKIELQGKVWHLARDEDAAADDDPRDPDIELDAWREMQAEALHENGEAEAPPEVSPSDGANVAAGPDQPIAPPASTS